ncbi:DUF485 domain-containing protein [Macrococcus armenti]|uniref:DUF485 domain-containing protein n=1 Tax=Macrococcus armenti TaxID=2875764 RepID=A0ABY3ZUP3_9STAP|nr:DUF485 domain-containing protein [Macrococcus armenti]UBH08684.1 DUF485 domain-containing protein [Macrococcus armenti]UBH13206.1 DUF485 domain-containing protein [Macrococcus armenti]UBH15459.1 DUF485 domain-containing protein [Macrococcus armenti]UBH17819.1 DUF485 domain-containing protein [Macrococcus armenti]UBH20084.1 DUF485 domain-containing protein [Macrococcus armenti]
MMKQYDYNAIASDEKFKQLQKSRKSFIFPISLFFIVATVLFPILTGYTTILNNEAFWNISWAWVYAFLLFVMVWTLVTIYMKKAKQFDLESERIIQEYRQGDE